MPNSPEYYASLVKAGPGLNTESAKKAEELVKIQSFGQALEQADLSNERYFAQQRREDQELSNSINSILSINAGLDAKPDPSFSEVLLAGAELDAMGKQEALLSSLSDLPNLSKDSGIVSATAAFKTAIQNGSSKEINQALGDLKNSFNSALPRLDDAGKNKLSRDYKKLVELANTQATIKASAQDLEEYLGSKDLTTRTQELGKFNQDNSRLSYALKSPDKKNSDVVNELADLESNVYGSRLYNTEDLTVFKNTYVKTDDDLYAKFDMSYAAAKQYAVQNKLQNYQQQVAAIDKQIAEAVDQNQKNQLALTKANLNNEIAYLGQVNDKLKAESTPDIYLKKFYPEVYAKEKHRQALEMVKNRNFAAGDEIQWFGENGIFVRGAQAIKKNALNQVAGLAHLVGSNETGYRIRSGANLAAPPTLFLGADINKNNKIDQHEITRDIYGDAISFDQAKFEYKDENGKTVTNWNLQAPIEATLPIAFDVATTVLLTRGVGAAARGAGLTYSRVGSAVGMAESLPKLAPAISTFGSVTSTTFPRFYAEERANFKDDGDAMSVAIMRATVEGLTETIVPDSSFFKGSKQIGYLDKYIDPALDAISDGLSRIPGIGRMSFMADQLLTLVPPGSLGKLDALKIVAPTALRKTLSGATQETVEELASLVGNYFVDNYAAQPNNFEYEKQNELTWDSFQETLVEGFIPSLFISGFQVNAPTKVKQFDQFNNPIKDSNGKQVERWQYMPYVQRLEQARWNVATNPELYKQLAARDRAAGKITREQEIKQVAKIQQLATKFESMSDDLNNIKDLYGLAVDRERQYSYFNNLLHQEDLLGTDTSNFTAEELAEYENMTVQVTNEVLSTRKLISQTKALTDQEKQTNLKRVFEQRKDKLGEISMAEMLQLAHSLNPIIANLNKKQTPEFDFLKENYNDFYNSVIANLTDRVTNFINQAETNPESLTNLDLQTFAEVFGFPLANLSSLEGPMPEMLSEGAQGVTVPFMPTKPLVDRVKTLLTERSVYLNPEVFVASASKNLQNLELKSIQQSRMALAQLTPEEIESGEVNAALHPNLSKTQIFNLGIELQKNKQRVAKDGKDTLTNRVNQIRNNDYYFAKNDDGTYDLGMIQSANVQAAEAAKSQPVNTAFQGSASQQAQAEAEAERQAEEQARQEAEAAAAAQAGAPVEVDPESPLGEEIESQDEEVELHPVNVDLYNQYAALVAELNRTLNNSDLDPEERSQIISTFRSQLLADIKDQSDLTNIYSILVAAFPGNEAKITDFINKAEQGQLDTSLILGLPNGPANSFVNQVGKHIASIINGEVSGTPTETPTEAATPTVEPELVIDEEPTDVPEHNDQEVGQSLLSLQLEEGPFSLSLSMTSVNQNNKSLMDDPHVAFAQRILAVYSEKRGAQPAYKAYMASAMNIYRKLLPDSIETLERLQKLNRKLTADEEALLRAALQVKGIPLHNQEFINYLVANPSKIGSNILSLVVDSNLNPVYFRENGLEGSIDDVPLLISLKTKKHLNVNAAELALRSTIEAQGNSGFVTTDIIGISSSKQLSVSGLKNAKVYVHFEATPEEYATPFGKFTLNPGYTYVQIPGDPYQYQPVKLPQASPDFLIKLVEAFNNGMLPTGFSSEIYESAEAFKSYLENLFYFNADTQGLILGSTRGGKLVFKKKNKNGKYQAITGSEEVQLETIRNAFQDLRYMVSQNLLSTDQLTNQSTDQRTDKFYTLVYDQGGIRVKKFSTYEALILSPEFGAKVVMRANASFALSPELTIENTISNAEKGFETVVPAFPIVSDVPGVEVESSTEDPTVEVGQKQIKRGLQALKEATSEKEIAQAIINLEKNIKEGGKLTKEQQDLVNQKRQELKDKGFEIVDYTGEIWDEGMNIEVNFIDLEEGTNLTQEQIDAVEKELEKRKKSIEKLIELGLSEEDARRRQRDDLSIMTTIQPQLNKDGKMVQVAKVTALRIKVSEAEEILERSKKNPRNIQKERIDRITAKADIERRRQEQFKNAGEQSKKDGNANALANDLLQNAKVGDTITDNNGEGYEVTEVKTRKDGTKEVILVPFELVDGKKDYNPSGTILLSENNKKAASNLYEFAYTSPYGKRIIETYTYNVKDNLKQSNVPVQPINSKVKGSNNDGSIYKSTTTEKDGTIKINYEGYRESDGKQLSLSGRKLTKEEFLSEYQIDEDGLDLLDGVEKIIIREVRNNKGKLGISVRLKFSEGFMNAELAALEQSKSTEGRQLSLLEDQPRLTSEEIAEREAEQKAEREEEARQREIDRQNAIADEELYMEYQMEKEAFEALELTPVAQALSEMRVTQDSFKKFGDKNYLKGRGKGEGGRIARSYFKVGGFGVDQVAMRATDLNGGVEVTTDEVIEFMTRYPAGVGNSKSTSTSTYYGSFNPKYDSKYNSIQDLIKQKEKEARRQKRQGKEIAQDEFSVDNVEERDPWDIDPFTPRDSSPFDEFFRAIELENEITEAQNKAAEDWVNSHPIFKNTKFIFNKTLHHPLAYATWSKAAITLYADANYAEAYHEAWHEFSQMYLTPSQRQSLYAEARKIYGDLPLVELEEKLAESFRQFALSNGTQMPQEIADYEDSKNIFQKMWDFLTGFFTDKLTVDKYFSQLYKGNISSYTRNEDSGYFKTLYSSKLVLKHPDNEDKVFSFRDSQKILTQMDSLFVDIANKLGQPYGATFVNVVENPKLTTAVLQEMNKVIAEASKQYGAKVAENPTPAATSKFNYTSLLSSNANTLLTFFKSNSSLFNDKVRRVAIEETIENEQETGPLKEFSRLETSIDEMSQKTTAHPLIISAIKSLPMYKNRRPVKDTVFGMNTLGSFDLNWNSLQRTLSGSNSYEQLYARLTQLAKEQLQFRPLLEYLPKPAQRNVKQSTLNFKNLFYNTFAMPYIDGYISEIRIVEDENANSFVDFQIYKAQTSDVLNLSKVWDNVFVSSPSLYKLVDPDTGSYYLNTDKYFADYQIPAIPAGATVTEEALNTYKQQLLELLEPLGFNFTELAKQTILTRSAKDLQSDVKLIYNKIKSYAESEETGPIYKPMEVLRTAHKNTDGSTSGSEVRSTYKLIGAEIKVNVEYANDMRYNALNKKVWSVTPHTYMTRIVSALNDAERFPTLQSLFSSYPQLNDQYNEGGSYSLILSYLFDAAGNRRTEDDGTYRVAEIASLFGIKTEDNATKTVDSTEALKHFTEIQGFIKRGVEELNRLSGKSTTRSLVMPTSLMKELGIDNAAFDTPGKIVIPDSVIYQLVLANVYSEVQVAKRHADSPNPFFKKISPFLDDENTKPRLTYFENIFDEATRIDLYNHFANVSKESLGASLRQIQPELLAKVKQQYVEYIANNVKVSRSILTNAFDSNTVTVSTGDLTRYHVFSMFSRIEQHKLFFGHPYYYKADKDIEKRLSAWNAYGNYAVLDEQNIQEISKTGFTQRKAFLEHNNALGENKVEVNPDLNTDLNKISYLVLQDTIVDSETAKNSAAYQTRVPDLATGETVPLSSYYVNNTDAKKQDAAAFATLDFYANFYSMSTGVTLDMKKEFDRQNRIYGLYLQSQRGENVQAELEKALNEGPYYTFTIKKLQYAGHNLTQDKTIPVFHKYSVKPILPSEIIGDPNLALILQKLHASSADYAVFSSGTKIAETVEPISLFNTDGSVNANYVPSSVGKVDTQYLKEQVLIENKETFMSIFSTQFRKLLFKDSPVESEALYDQYREAIESLVDFDKIKFLSKIEDQEKLVSFIVSELSKKNIAEGTKDLIQLKENGELKYVLDAFVDRTIMESTMIASLKNAIIKQKVPGAQRVQYPVSLIRPGRKLRYYDLVDGKVTKAETIVSFSKGYYPLLNLQYNGKPIGEFNEFGQPINLFSAVQRLNEALNNPLFRSKYADILDKALTIAAIRVPGQDYNSMENFQIVEFLPQESGEIILVPDEMVIKSGSDFDIDKLFCYDPYLESDGSVRTNTLTGEDAFDYEEELREELADNKLILKETLRERNGLAAQVAQIIEKYGFDSNTIRLKELYAKLKAADTVTEDEQEIEEMDRTTLAERMRERMLGGSGTITKKSQEINNETKRIRKALFEAREEGLSDAINALSNQINDLNSRNKFLTNEIKAIRGRMSNSLLLTISERLSQQDVFDKLLRPNSSDVVKKLANEFGIQSEWTKASYTNIINPIYQLYVHRLNSFKKALGQDAKMNVLFAILQKTGLKVIDKKAVAAYPLNANGKKDGVLDFSQSNGVDGTRIGDLTGQLITAHVDIEKHDEVAWINLNVRINPVTNYMVGVGSSFRDIVKFVNLGYTAAGAKTPSTSSIVLYGRGNSRMNDSEFIQSILDGIYEKSNKWANENQTILPEVQLLSNSVTKFNTFGLGSLKAQVAKIIEANPEIILNDTTGYGNLVRFISFLSVKDQQSKLFTLSSNTDFDTFSPQNFEAFRKGANELRLLMKENFFNQDAIKRVISESVVSPFQIQADIFETFEKIFPISANAELGTLITTAFTSVKKSNPTLEYDQFSRVLKNDLLYALFRNNVSQVAEMENLLDKRNPGNIVAIYENLKARLFERKITSDNLIFDGVSFATEETSAFIRTGFSSVDAEDSVNVLREEFEMGLNWAHPDLDPNNEDDAELQKDMQSFFLAYAYAGIIGSQLNKKYDSYLPYIPETVYTTRMPSIIKNFAEEMTNTLEQVNKAIYDFVSADNSAEILKESKEYLIADATDYTEVVNDIVQDKLYQLLSGSNTFAAKFLKRFLQNHPEFQGKYGTNRDLIYFKDYDLSRESITPTMKNEVPTTEVSSPRKYTPKEVLKLEPNQVFVFGANTVGHHGAGGAGYAMFGNGAANYTVYPKGAKGKWAEYGVVNQLMEGLEGKSFGIITKFASVETNDKGEPAVRIGAKRSVDLSVVEDSIVAMLQTAQQNPELEFLVSEIGIKLAGWNPGHIKTIFAKNINLIGDNVILPKIFEVRDSKGAPSMVTVANTIDLEVKPENYEAIRQEAIKASFNELSEQSEAFKNFCKGVS